MKKCSKCEQTKELVEFHRRGAGHQPYCKACKKSDDAKYREANMAYFIQRARQQKREMAAWYESLKTNQPCVDCDGRFDPIAMQWDHLPGSSKVGNVSSLVANANKQAILDEIAKCELVCANCHAVRTKQRRTCSIFGV